MGFPTSDLGTCVRDPVEKARPALVSTGLHLLRKSWPVLERLQFGEPSECDQVLAWEIVGIIGVLSGEIDGPGR